MILFLESFTDYWSDGVQALTQLWSHVTSPSAFVFNMKLPAFWICLPCIFFGLVEINDFQGGLTVTSAKTKSLTSPCDIRCFIQAQQYGMTGKCSNKLVFQH